MSHLGSGDQANPIVEWSFSQFRKGSIFGSSIKVPVECFLHSSTQIGNKILYYGGANAYGEPQSQLYIFDTSKQSWSCPIEMSSQTHDQDPGPRFGHTATLVEMHPPKILIWGGVINAGTFEFEAPDGLDFDLPSITNKKNQFMSWRQRGKKSNINEEMDDSVYFLELTGDNWKWTKPLVHGNSSSKPAPRIEHTSCKIGANEIMIFGGWTTQPVNDVWVLNTVDLQWKNEVTSGIQAKPRYRHTSEVLGSKMYIFGGSDTPDDIAEACGYLSLHELDLETLQWSHPMLAGNNPFPRSGHASAVVGATTVAIFGGKRNNTNYLNDLILIDLSSFVCTTVDCVATHLPTPISNATLSAIGNKLYVFGGTDNQGNCYDGIRELNIADYLNSNDITVAQGLSSEYSFKILIIGDASVGKSALLMRFAEDAFLPTYTTTLGIDFSSRMIRVDKAICKLEIWDTAGQERFANITANYYRGAQGCLVVYDISERKSFENAAIWFDRARQLGGDNLVSLLIGNKTDLPAEDRQVSLEEGFALANKLGIPFIETSALSGRNVEGAFVSMSSKIKQSVDRLGLNGVKNHKSMQQTGSMHSAAGDRKMSGCGCG